MPTDAHIGRTYEFVEPPLEKRQKNKLTFSELLEVLNLKFFLKK